MAGRSWAIPGFGDFLVGCYEIVGWVATRIFLIFVPKAKRFWGFAILIGFFMLAKLGDPIAASLVASALVLLAACVRAVDIARSRAALRQILGNPSAPMDSALPAHGSPTIEALQDVASALSFATRGEAVSAQLLAARVDRKALDREASQCLEAALAFAAQTLGDGEEAARKAALALPLGNPDLDRRLGRIVLHSAWDDPERLRMIVRNWDGSKPPLSEMTLLAALRPMSSAQRQERIALVDADVLSSLAADAREVGDGVLADDLVAHAKRRGPYR
jgi:hypothetical protein